MLIPLNSLFFQCTAHHRDLHSFPTRRSSDLTDEESPASHLTVSFASRSRGQARKRECFEKPFTGAGIAMIWRFGHCRGFWRDRKSTRLNSSHLGISYAVFCLKKKK